MQDRINIKETNGHLLIWVKWRSGYALPLLTTVVAGLFAIVFGATAARASGLVPGAEGEPSVVQLVTNLVLLCMACYSLMAYWINATVIDVCTLDLRVYADPLPFPYPRRKRIPTSQLRQLYVVRNLVPVKSYLSAGDSEYGKSASVTFHLGDPEYQKSASVTFHLVAELTDGSRLDLIRHVGAKGKDLARGLEEKLESYLAIEDVQVEGEYRD